MAKLYFSYSAMNAGKSTLLLQAAHNYTERGLVPYLIKTILDDRDGLGIIASRVGVSKAAENFEVDEDLFDKIETRLSNGLVHCIFVDEAHFLTSQQVWQLAQVVDDLNIPVMCYGLRTDFQGKLFPGSSELMAIADDLREIRTIDESGKKATMNLRLHSDGTVAVDGPQNQIGGNESYVSVSRKKWRKEMSQ